MCWKIVKKWVLEFCSDRPSFVPRLAFIVPHGTSLKCSPETREQHLYITLQAKSAKPLKPGCLRLRFLFHPSVFVQGFKV